jgi:glycerophosphoryl diester phosphodiesterase
MKIIGHRGARGLAPENTIVSLQKALQHHVDMLEVDLRVTKDNVVVLHHNSWLADPSGTRLKIKDYSYAELVTRKPDLPTLDDTLDAIGHQVPLYIEVKHYESVEPVVRILKQRLRKDWQPADFLLGSKSQKILVELHQKLPEIKKIVIEPLSGLRAIHRARQVGTKRLAMQQLWLWWGFIRIISRGGWQLYGYAINDPSKARRWAKWGLAGVITDYPDRFEK